MDRNDIRTAVVAGIDEILGSWRNRFISSDSRRLLTAQRNLTIKSDAYVDALLAEYNALPLTAYQGDDVEFTAEQKTQMEALNIDWARLLSLVQKAPQIVLIIQSLIALLADPTPAPTPPVMSKGAGCDHKACCEAVLKAALHTACLAAQHSQCCK
jgi:hypothetical protein